MVDAIGSIHGMREQIDTGKPVVMPNCTVSIADPTSLAAYAELGIHGIAAPPQYPAWIEAWSRNKGADCVIVTLASAGRPELALALEVISKGPFRVARFMGGRHANGNFPLMLRDASISKHDLDVAFASLHKTRPDIDLIHLERLTSSIEAVANPLLPFNSHRSPNIALAVDLTGGFEGVLSRANAKRKRKKHRSSSRKFDEAGGFRILTAKTLIDVDRLLDAFFAMKEHRFRKMGISNVFEDSPTQNFFRELFSSALDTSRPAFFLSGLEVNGVLRAVTGSSRCGSRVICEFGAIAEDDLAHASPGDFLFFENIKSASDQGNAIYDFSVGDEPYKRLWCDIEIVQNDVRVPLSTKGRFYGLSLRGMASAKSFIKNNRVIWNLVKSIRRRRAEAPTRSED